MLLWAKDLFPICRSITGEGLRQTIFYFKKINPNIKVLSLKSGTKVFDWIIPKEWNIKDSYIQHESGKKYAEFSKSNLHIVNYSLPVNKWISKKQLLKHLHTEPSQPDAVPYVTSYYKSYWGFCLTEKQKKKLPDGKYRVYINSTLKRGTLNMAECVIKGRNKKEIFFSTYICHPSMANNELSGPVLSSALIKYIKEFYKNTKFTYRFVFVPETIGSIAYLKQKYKQLKKNVISGFVLSCVGDERNYSHIRSKEGNCLSDRAMFASFIGFKKTKVFSYLDRGSDERQYCAPGIDLPVCGFCRSKYGEYPEYHTNKDNFKVVTEKGLQDSFNLMKNIIDAFELDLYPQTQILCEPQLSKRNLYPTLSQKNNMTKSIKDKLNLLAYSNGKTSIFDISIKINLPLEKIVSEVKILKKLNLLKNN